jgi:hypothetical protein
MITSRKDQAERLRCGLIAGYTDASDVVRWADAIIETEAVPPAAVLELSLGANQPRETLVQLLASMPGEINHVALMRGLLGEYLTELEVDPARGDIIARNLYALANSGDLPDDEFGHEPSAFDDMFASVRAQWGLYTRDDAVMQLRNYLAVQARRA